MTFDLYFYDGSKKLSETPMGGYDGITISGAQANPTKDGYTFLGWATTNGGSVVVTAGETSSMSLGTLATLTNSARALYAVWGEDVPLYADQKVKVDGMYQTIRPKVAKSALNYEAGGTIESALASKQPVGDYATNTALTQGLATKQPVGDYALKSDIASVYKVMGSCTNANLPTSPSKGDVWNITDNGTYPAGSNVVWTGSAWDKLSETVDLSTYATKSELSTVRSEIESAQPVITVSATQPTNFKAGDLWLKEV